MDTLYMYVQIYSHYWCGAKKLPNMNTLWQRTLSTPVTEAMLWGEGHKHGGLVSGRVSPDWQAGHGRL